MNSLSGSFRTTGPERLAIIQCRTKLNMSVNQIAQTMRRSVATVQKYVANMGMDNRRMSPSKRQHLSRCFKENVNNLRFRLKMYLQGLSGFEDVILCKSVPLVTLDWFLSTENCLGDEEGDPA